MITNMLLKLFFYQSLPHRLPLRALKEMPCLLFPYIFVRHDDIPHLIVLLEHLYRVLEKRLLEFVVANHNQHFFSLVSQVKSYCLEVCYWLASFPVEK